MASPACIVKLSRSLSRILGLSSKSIPSCRDFCTHQLSDKESEDDSLLEDVQNSEESDQKEPNTTVKANANPPVDAGIYKAILLGEVGKFPVQKKLRSGRVVTSFTVGTGGKHKYGKFLEGEASKENAERDIVQWHRVTIHLENLGGIAMQHAKKGAHVYVEGNLETQIFNDPVSGIITRIREVAIRRGGRLIFLDGGTSTSNKFQETEVSQA